MKDWLIKYWAEVACVGLTTYIIAMWRQFMAWRNGMRAILRYEIIQACNFWMKEGYCPQFDRDAICDMFEQYKALKGNHGVQTKVDDFLKLPMERPTRKRIKGSQPLS